MRINKLKKFCHLHINQELEVVYLRRGSITVTYDTENFTLFSGQAMFILPYHPHAFSHSDDSDCDILMFPKNIFGAFTDKYKNRGERTVFNIEPAVACYIDSLLEQYGKNTDDFTDKAIFYALANLHIKGNRFPVAKSSAHDQLNKTIEYIKDNLSCEITVLQLAKNAGMNPRKLSNAFIESFGIKLVDFIANVRIQQAIFYIETTSLSVTEISYRAGFGSLRNFNRIFKDRVGITPSEYRKHL